MAKFSDIKVRVEEQCDGGSFAPDKHARWANDLRTNLVMDVGIRGIYGLYFLYKEAKVKGGSVLNEPNYALPDDFIDHLLVFYDGVCLTGSPVKMLGITFDTTSTGSPQWVQLIGTHFRLRKAPDEAGKEIKLLYNGLPAKVPAEDNDEFIDYFLNTFPDLHIFGMAESAHLSQGNRVGAKYYGDKNNAEKRKLQLHNRKHYSNVNMRFSTWDEYESAKRLVFPQYQET